MPSDKASRLIYDAYEIAPGVERSGGSGRYEDRAQEGETPQFWTLYGHVEDHGVDTIGKFPSRQAAEEVYSRITGQDISESYPEDVRARLKKAAPELLSAMEAGIPGLAFYAVMAHASGNPRLAKEIDHVLQHMVENYIEATGNLPLGMGMNATPDWSWFELMSTSDEPPDTAASPTQPPPVSLGSLKHRTFGPPASPPEPAPASEPDDDIGW